MRECSIEVAMEFIDQHFNSAPNDMVPRDQRCMLMGAFSSLVVISERYAFVGRAIMKPILEAMRSAATLIFHSKAESAIRGMFLPYQ